VTRQIEQELRDNTRVQLLCKALTVCSDEELALCFLRDLLTWEEMLDFANRLSAAQLLLEGKNQTVTAERLELSRSTVHDVADWSTGPFSTGGYKEVFERLGRQEVQPDAEQSMESPVG
jgi:uncharacterized protein YerC